MHRHIVYAGLVAGSLLFSGCFGSDEDVTGDSQSHVLAANTSMNGAIGQMTSGDYDYGQEDLTQLTQAHQEYKAALAANSKDNQAHFGLALTTVLLAAQNHQVSDLLNRTVEAPSPFDPALVDDVPAKEALLLKKARTLATTFPEFHELQDALAEQMLPALEEGIGHLNTVYQDAAFNMQLTIDGKSREIDHAEVGLVLAGLKALKGFLTLFLSYDMDFDKDGSYDYLDALSSLNGVEDLDQLTADQISALDQVVALMTPGSSFLSVRSGWQNKIAAVHGDLVDAVKIARASLASIRTETDAQSDDLLRLCSSAVSSDCIGEDELSSALDAMDTASKYLEQPYVLDIPDLDTAISLDFSAFFKAQDYKKMLPHYAFYPKAEWSSQKPVFYFTDKAGNFTGDINDLDELSQSYDEGEMTPGEMVDALQTILHFQDATFGGYLAGATDASVWNLIRKSAVQDEEDVGMDGVAKLGRKAMAPEFILETSLR